MNPLALVALELAACTCVVVLTGVRLSHYGDVIAERTGLGGAWIGVLLMASVTSLPELVTGASSMLLFDTPDIGVGDVVGSCMFNLVILAWLDFRQPAPLSASVHRGHVLAAAFGLVLLGLAGLAMLAGPHAPAIGWFGLQSLLFIVVYLFAVRTVFRYERSLRRAAPEGAGGERRFGAATLRRTTVLFSLNAALLVTAAMFLPALGGQFATVTGIGQSFVGSLVIAASTSMPEIVVSVAAARMGAIDMAVANLFGSNLINLAVLGLDDLLYLPGPLLAVASPAHLVPILAAMTMTAIAVIGLTYRAERKRFRLSWDAIALLAVYIIGVLLLWRVQ